MGTVISKAEPTRADELYKAQTRWKILEDQMVDDLATACGFPRITEKPGWPVEDWSFDDYDSSFEWHGARPEFIPTPEQVKACLAFGFERFWVNYSDGTERYFTANPDCPVGGWHRNKATHELIA